MGASDAEKEVSVFSSHPYPHPHPPPHPPQHAGSIALGLGLLLTLLTFNSRRVSALLCRRRALTKLLSASAITAAARRRSAPGSAELRSHRRGTISEGLTRPPTHRPLAEELARCTADPAVPLSALDQASLALAPTLHPSTFHPSSLHPAPSTLYPSPFTP